MIDSLNGTLIEKDIGTAVVECGGVGYLARITNFCLSALPDVGKPVKLYTYLNVYENGVDLFGFADKKERECFKMLIDVSSVGPAKALAILSELSPSDFATAVVTGDQAQLTRASGVGAKMAQLVILKLKDKISKEMGELLSGKRLEPIEAGVTAKSAEVIDALMVLGYTQHEAKRAAGALELENMSVEEAISKALATLAG